MHTDPLAKNFGPFAAEIVANVRLAQLYACIVESSIVGLSSQGERFLGDFHLRQIGASGDLRHFFAIDIPAHYVHGSVSSNGILTQDLVKWDEPFQQILP